jgi:hypothetical protein
VLVNFAHGLIYCGVAEMIHREENITLEWLDNTQEILSRANHLLTMQTIDILMNLAEMKVANQADLADIKIGDMMALVAMAKQSVCNKQESAKILRFNSKVTPKADDHFVRGDQEDQDLVEATILPFRPKVGRHYFTRL